MEKPTETYKFKDNKTLEIYVDADPQSPRENDNLGIMICGHQRYELGDEQIKPSDFFSWSDVKKKLEEDGAISIMPLRLYDHSGISLSIGNSYPFNDEWDSMMVGFIYTNKKQLEMTGVKYDPADPLTLANIRAQLEGEIKEYNTYLSGEVYGYVLRAAPKICGTCKHNDGGEEIDSCWGFFGYNIMENGILDSLPEEIQKEIKEIKEKKLR